MKEGNKTLVSRLKAVLKTGGAFSISELAKKVGYQEVSVSSALSQLRREGMKIGKHFYRRGETSCPMPKHSKGINQYFRK